jgi:hypothetical protein
MSKNNFKPHLVVLPEDKANANIVTGFNKAVAAKQFLLLKPAGGWLEVLNAFHQIHVAELRRFQHRYVLLVVDFDNDPNRFEYIRARIPSDLEERTFVVGSFTNPEKLRSSMGQSLESIGTAIAEDCRNRTDFTWRHPLLQHNLLEFERLNKLIRPILF